MSTFMLLVVRPTTRPAPRAMAAPRARAARPVRTVTGWRSAKTIGFMAVSHGRGHEARCRAVYQGGGASARPETCSIVGRAAVTATRLSPKRPALRVRDALPMPGAGALGCLADSVAGHRLVEPYARAW